MRQLVSARGQLCTERCETLLAWRWAKNCLDSTEGAGIEVYVYMQEDVSNVSLFGPSTPSILFRVILLLILALFYLS